MSSLCISGRLPDGSESYDSIRPRSELVRFMRTLDPESPRFQVIQRALLGSGMPCFVEPVSERKYSLICTGARLLGGGPAHSLPISNGYSPPMPGRNHGSEELLSRVSRRVSIRPHVQQPQENRNYHLGSTGGRNPPTSITIPDRAEPGDTFTTTPLQGCSVIVTRAGPNQLRIFHDHGTPCIVNDIYNGLPIDYSLSYLEGRDYSVNDLIQRQGRCGERTDFRIIYGLRRGIGGHWDRVIQQQRIERGRGGLGGGSLYSEL